MKRCSKCKETKALSAYYKDKSKKDGLRYYCKPCSNASVAKWTEKHRDLKYAKNRLWREANPEKAREVMRRWRKANKGRVNAWNSKRRARKLQATIRLTKKQKQDIEILYKVASYLSKRTGKNYHVDHVVPLRSEKVCGLHVLANLQILEASENSKKSNKFGGEQ